MITWSERFETGQAQIDAEHREFFAQINALKEAVDRGAGRERIVELVILLQKYSLGHFAREEAHMQRIACPAAKENTCAHREFSAKLDGWLELLTMSGAPVSFLVDVQREATAWIEAHILNVDCRMRGCRLK